jgi:NAD(P)-dependent dehydrogenase (short-subunit alcohol dehydrogenase family)
MTKTIVITGGARGIGAATARVAAKRGWSVAFSYLSNDEAANATAAAADGGSGEGKRHGLLTCNGRREPLDSTRFPAERGNLEIYWPLIISAVDLLVCCLTAGVTCSPTCGSILRRITRLVASIDHQLGLRLTRCVG